MYLQQYKLHSRILSCNPQNDGHDHHHGDLQDSMSWTRKIIYEGLFSGGELHVVCIVCILCLVAVLIRHSLLCI